MSAKVPQSSREIQRSLRQILRRKQSRIDLELLLDRLISAFGGEEMLSLEYKRVFDASAKNPMVQQKILLMIQQLIYATTIHGMGKQVDVSQLDDQSLIALLGHKLGVVEADAEEEAEPGDAAAAPDAGPAAAAAAGLRFARDDPGDPESADPAADRPE